MRNIFTKVGCVVTTTILTVIHTLGAEGANGFFQLLKGPSDTFSLELQVFLPSKSLVKKYSEKKEFKTLKPLHVLYSNGKLNINEHGALDLPTDEFSAGIRLPDNLPLNADAYKAKQLFSGVEDEGEFIRTSRERGVIESTIVSKYTTLEDIYYANLAGQFLTCVAQYVVKHEVPLHHPLVVGGSVDILKKKRRKHGQKVKTE